MLRTNSLIDLLTSMTQMVVGYNRVDSYSSCNKLVKKLSKIKKKPQKFEKSINLKELSFLIFDTRLAFTKIGFSYIKLIIENY